MASQRSTTSEPGGNPAERFFKYFQHEITALQEQMDRLGSTALVGGERRDATDHCLAGITRLSSEVKDASATLPPYDLRTYSEAIKALQDKLAETQAQHIPKQKFSFKTRKNESAISLQDAAELAAEKRKSILKFPAGSGASSFATTPVHLVTPPNEKSVHQTQKSSDTAGSSITNETSQDSHVEGSGRVNEQRPQLTKSSTTTSLSTEANAYIILPPSASRANTPCTLSGLVSCCIDLSIPTADTAPFASLTISNVKSSLLICGTVAGPAHITSVKNSTILISCRQFRMHDCENVEIYLYCTSRPIIEDCKAVRFGEMPTFYTDLLHSSSALSNQAIGENMWEHVDDFKWLRSEQNPNWMILPVNERVTDDVWKEIILDKKPGMSVDEILKMTSITR